MWFGIPIAGFIDDDKRPLALSREILPSGGPFFFPMESQVSGCTNGSSFRGLAFVGLYRPIGSFGATDRPG
jgi:hypothetical protein